MIKFHLDKLLKDREITQKDLCEIAKIRPGTINLYYHGYAKRLNVNDLDKICKALDCMIGDLIEYVPRKKRK